MDKIVFTQEQFLEALKDSKKDDIIMWDEYGTDYKEKHACTCKEIGKGVMCPYCAKKTIEANRITNMLSRENEAWEKRMLELKIPKY